jgi:hypothetical protein
VVHVPRTLYSCTPDYQGFSFAFTCLLLPLVVRFLGRIWDFNGFWPAFRLLALEIDTL